MEQKRIVETLQGAFVSSGHIKQRKVLSNIEQKRAVEALQGAISTGHIKKGTFVQIWNKKQQKKACSEPFSEQGELLQSMEEEGTSNI